METALEGRRPPPAGFWIRFAAVVVDLVVFIVAETLLRLFTGALWGAGVVESRMFESAVVFFGVVFDAVYHVTLHGMFGQTVGKMAVNIRVVQLDGRPLSWGIATIRYLGAWISLLPFGIGFLMAALRADKRALHDLLAGTRVIRVGDGGGMA
jgi:uncharacterized RDD family membrane protein YckC